ncbi:hypothetical protein Droror1_Dr00001418 [Drosera rotundifolia]
MLSNDEIRDIFTIIKFPTPPLLPNNPKSNSNDMIFRHLINHVRLIIKDIFIISQLSLTFTMRFTVNLSALFSKLSIKFKTPRDRKPKQESSTSNVDDHVDEDVLALDLAIKASLMDKVNRLWHHDVVHDDETRRVALSMFICNICSEAKFPHESFAIKGCTHSYCFDCVRSYVGAKLEDGVSNVKCPEPGCDGTLDPEHCRDILPKDMYVKWGKSLCESGILASEKFYCPFKNCSAMMIGDGSEGLTNSECPECKRLFCVRCKVMWHEGMECGEYQKLKKNEKCVEAIMFKKLADNKKWKRCPACKMYVERIDGCNYILCRCGVSFCYSCGSIHNDHTYHRCPKCKLIWS